MVFVMVPSCIGASVSNVLRYVFPKVAYAKNEDYQTTVNLILSDIYVIQIIKNY